MMTATLLPDAEHEGAHGENSDSVQYRLKRVSRRACFFSRFALGSCQAVFSFFSPEGASYQSPGYRPISAKIRLDRVAPNGASRK
jgi:hypothetical protein